jgi:hypothetical protein
MANDAALEQAIAALLEDRAEIDLAIAALQRRLARAAGSPAGPTGPAMTATASGGDIVTHPGEFHQHTLTQVAEKILRRTMRPVKTQELMVAIQRAQFEMGSKNPSQSLYTSLARHKGFLKVRPNTWALAEWFPNVGGKTGEAEPRKRRRKTRKSSQPKLLADKTPEKAETDSGLFMKAG